MRSELKRSGVVCDISDVEQDEMPRETDDEVYDHAVPSKS